MSRLPSALVGVGALLWATPLTAQMLEARAVAPFVGLPSAITPSLQYAQFIVRVPPSGGGGASCTPNMAAGSTPAQINTAITNGTDPVTLCFEAGSYTWGGGTVIAPPLTKSVTLICVTEGACDVSYSGGFPGTWRPGCCAGGSSSKLYRISGFDFTPVAAGTTWFAWDDSSETTLSNLRIDHCTWALDDDDQIVNMSQSSVVYLYGVWDHNTITSATANTPIPFEFSAAYDSTSPVTRRLGSEKNMFFEDNVLTITSTGFSGCHDAWGSSNAMVWRFNTLTNCHMATHGTKHGYGPSNVEWYGNTMTINSTFWDPTGYRVWHHQGSGTIALWGNHMTTSSALSSNTASIQDYRSFQPNGDPECDGGDAIDGNRQPEATYEGYPCFHQPGRDMDGAYFPVFSFRNVDLNTGNQFNIVSNPGGGESPDYSSLHLNANRDLYVAVSKDEQTSATSPFNGTTGIGHGTLANRPTTCTTSGETGLGNGDSGVMYWATDQGSWNQSTSNPRGVQQNGADGVLYHCSATNTWTVYYTPYTYPHPLNN